MYNLTFFLIQWSRPLLAIRNNAGLRHWRCFSDQEALTIFYTINGLNLHIQG